MLRINLCGGLLSRASDSVDNSGYLLVIFRKLGCVAAAVAVNPFTFNSVENISNLTNDPGK